MDQAATPQSNQPSPIISGVPLQTQGPANSIPTPLSGVDQLEQQIQALEKQKAEEEQGKIKTYITDSQQSLSPPFPPQPLGRPNPFQNAAPISKERKDQYISGSSPEMTPIREVKAEFEAPPEVAKFMEKVPDPVTITLPKPVNDEYGEILLQATQIPKPKIVLPIDEEELEKAFHHKVADSVRWLGEWCRRVIALAPGRVFYNNSKE